MVIESFADNRQDQQARAAERVAARTEERRSVVEAMRSPGGLAAVNPAERLARRLDRVTRYYAAEPLPYTPSAVPSAEPEQVIDVALERAKSAAEAPVVATTAEALVAATEGTALSDPVAQAAAVLEKVINNPDFLEVRYLEAGAAAARAVCRVDIQNELGRVVGYGTGSLVSPRLILTNHHVLPSAQAAALSSVEFDYQDGIDGQPLPARQFPLDPESFFLADQERDFAIVAVAAPAQVLSEFGLNRLIEAEGKALVGEYVTIVQHPRGEKKQVVLRDNQIVDFLDEFLHYAADTEPGSSGSPVFNDQWEIVALHHASVPAPDHHEFGGIVNEGIRASRILKFVRAQQHGPSEQQLVDQLFAPEQIRLAPRAASTDEGAQVGREAAEDAPAASTGARVSGSGPVRVSIPLEISVALGSVSVETDSTPGVSVAAPEQAQTTEDEAISIDPDYGSRRGYDPDFLGAGPASVPLPTLSDALLEQAARNEAATAGHEHVLPYHHFSVVLNRERRLACLTAVNIDGRTGRRIKREADHWYFDPRIPPEQQTGEAVYTANELDRGHLVRRLDPAWGETLGSAKSANDDTFHFTNCTPQHKDFNQNRTTWAGLEDYLLEHAANLKFRASVFTGPVLADDDDDYRGVKLPRQFWKVAVMVKKGGQLSASGYLLSQEALLQGLESAEEFSYGDYRTYQVPLPRIEELTGIGFGELLAADPLAGLEAEIAEREIARPSDLVV